MHMRKPKNPSHIFRHAISYTRTHSATANGIRYLKKFKPNSPNKSNTLLCIHDMYICVLRNMIELMVEDGI